MQKVDESPFHFICTLKCVCTDATLQSSNSENPKSSKPSQLYQRLLQHSTLTAPGVWSLFIVDEVMVDDLWSFNSHSILIPTFFFLFFSVKWCDRERNQPHSEMESWLLLSVGSKREKQPPHWEIGGHAILPTGSERSCVCVCCCCFQLAYFTSMCGWVRV